MRCIYVWEKLLPEKRQFKCTLTYEENIIANKCTP